MSDAAESNRLEDPLQPALEKAEAELAKHLDEACEAGTEPITQLRRRVEERSVAGSADTPADRSDSTTPLPPEAGGRVREFRDRHGRAWRVWEVRPGLGRPLSEIHRYLGDYINGWLAFSCLDNEARKRLPDFPPDWLQMSDREVEALLYQAVDVPKRN
jgi:hypothetical protein